MKNDIKHLIIEYIRQEKHFKTMTISIVTNKGYDVAEWFSSDARLGLPTKANQIRLYTFKKGIKDNSVIRIKRDTSIVFLISIMFCDPKNNICGYKLGFSKKTDCLRITHNYNIYD